MNSFVFLFIFLILISCETTTKSRVDEKNKKEGRLLMKATSEPSVKIKK